jgi:hypothetical protein
VSNWTVISWLDIPASTGKKRIHLVFTKLSTKGPEDIETVLVDHKIWYECKICGKRYDSRVYTNNHIRIEHKRPKQHLCSFCGKSFTQKWVMVKHMKVHIDRPHQCSMPCASRNAYVLTFLSSIKTDFDIIHCQSVNCLFSNVFSSKKIYTCY